MTPLERAARDRLTRYLAARDKYAAHARALGANPEHVPGDAIDNQADTAEVLPIPGPGGLLGGHLFPRPGSASFPLRERDLRLVLAALDRHETIAEAVLDTARQVAGHTGRFGPVPERVVVTYQADRPTAEQEPHRLTVTLATIHEPATWCTNADPQFLRQREIPHRALTHTAACDALKYGQRCPFDDFEGTGGADDRPAEPGECLGWFWASKSWTDSGWEYDAGIEWQRDEPAPASEPCLCYRGGCYVGLTGPCTCAPRGVQGCPCLAPDAAQPPKAGE